VIPTLGTRLGFLRECIASIEKIKGSEYVVICPEKALSALFLQGIHPSRVLSENESPGGAASAINQGLSYFLSNSKISTVAWIGDDDSLDPDGVMTSLDIIALNPSFSAVIGYCDYVDEQSTKIYEATPTPRDVSLLSFKGNKIPQPGSIFRARSLQIAGLLDPQIKYAFDQDLFHRLKRVGQIGINKRRVATYRWHPDSLSFNGGRAAVRESFLLRMKFVPKLLSFVPILHYLAYLALYPFAKPKLR